MNLRCIYCQTPFTLARTEMLSAIVTMNERGQTHYDAHCPRCRRANSISRQRMELFFPNWQDAAKLAAAEAKAEAAPASAAVKTEPLPKPVKAAVKKAPVKAAKAPAAKKSTAKAVEKKVAAKGKKK
jgi:phage FluMu protein Com